VDYRQKLGAGSALSTIGALGIVLNAFLGWSEVGAPWSFLLGFVFGVMSGAGVALVISGLVDRRASQ
jgi:hypothetical protein